MSESVTSSPGVVIIGAGHAGATVAALLRQHNYAGPVTLVGDEPDPPYHRPPLSKKFSDEAMVQWLKPTDFYRANDIELLLSTRVTGIDIDARRVRFDDGGYRDYGTVVIATGAAPRTISVPGVNADGVSTLRTIADARRLGAAMRDVNSLAVIGGGYVGMEVAAVARSLGADVTVVERENRILARVASEEFSARLTAHHQARGTRVVTGYDVAGFETVGGRVAAVRAEDGSMITCDHVLLGVGAVPNIELAQHCGIACDGGIVVDRSGHTNVPGVMAIGDVTRRPHDLLDGLHRLESIPSAVEQAKHAAAAIAGLTAGKHEPPWFWSDQFDLKLKIVGLLEDNSVAVARSGSAPDSFALFHLRPDLTVCAVETANSPKDFMVGKRLIADRSAVDPVILADSGISIGHIALATAADR